MTPNPLDLFASIRIHGLVSSQEGERLSIELDRSVSFPIPVWHDPDQRPKDPEGDVSARPLSTADFLNLELEACISAPHKPISSHSNPLALGYGRSGDVYPLEVVAIRQLPQSLFQSRVHHVDIEALKKSLPPLCMKVARPTYARSVAREAWFYERLDKEELMGAVSPSCYGLFHTKVTSNLSILLPPDYDEVVEEQYERNPDGTSVMSEDESDRFMDDPFASHKSSPWLSFRESKDSPTITALILERVGERMTMEEYAMDENRNDINSIYQEDLRYALIRHRDGRLPNVLRAPPTARICPIHNRAHRWFLVDYERSLLVTMREEEELYYQYTSLSSWVHCGGRDIPYGA
ncbi:protein kinase subdomain-containing protein PKL/ccin3 [Coprinopsis cinerea okayama7|uniref:Protein kinase subdomain-containing protein PKL/ccin3 n=1 Tax=Coprinopsis cinerea (strain Okayama-7 / 130 / ATCC MYA-4618 / FGSC 9003) TaxID=240176 RepID=A8N502_COPC7|nr:protein kinase subdomain-containing protein PKL/ccin3 [Coprinopsis cinerea okayama7\|eukprot:XP_001829891.2 protein kinase subdomain-containing protein PKL/ccin3 [Coprinopsis cinerea okayama7\